MKTIKLSDMQNAGLGVQNIIEYQKEILVWNEQEKQVEATKNDVVEMKRYVSYPFPVTHSLIADAVTQTGELDFELVDDTQPLPPVEPTLEEKKAILIANIRNAEQAARLLLIPIGKERLMAMHSNRIVIADALVRQKQIEEWTKEGKTFASDEIQTVVETARDPDDHSFMIELKSIQDQIEKHSWWAAEQESVVADLTEQNVDQWKMPEIEK